MTREHLSSDGRFRFTIGERLVLEHVASGRVLLSLDAAHGEAETAYFTPDGSQLVLALTRRDRAFVRLPAVIELATGLWYAMDPRHASAPLGDVHDLATTFATGGRPRERAPEELARWELPTEPAPAPEAPAPPTHSPVPPLAAGDALAPAIETPSGSAAGPLPSLPLLRPDESTEGPSDQPPPPPPPPPDELSTSDAAWRFVWDPLTRAARLLRAAEGTSEIEFRSLGLEVHAVAPHFRHLVIDYPTPTPPGGIHIWLAVDLDTSTFFLDFWREPLSPNYDLAHLAAYLRGERVPPAEGASATAEPRSDPR